MSYPPPQSPAPGPQGPPGGYGTPSGFGGPPPSGPPSQRPTVPLWFTITALVLLVLILVFSILTWNTNRAAHSRDVEYTCKTLKYDYDGQTKEELSKRDEIVADVYGCDDADLP